MTLEQLKKVTHAFDSFTTISTAHMDNYYKGVFPSHCMCGAEMIISENNTQLQCCNPACYLKMAYRLAYFINKLGYKGFGEASALTLVQRTYKIFRYPTFLSAFLLEHSDVYMSLGDASSNIFEEIREDLHERQIYFVDAISALGIPNIGSRSTLFDVVKSPVLFLKYLIQDKTDELCDVCGIYADSTRYYLAMSKLDAVTLFKDVMPNILDTPKSEIFVAITGKVSVNGTDYTRSQFIELCEHINDGSGSCYKIIETKAESKLQYVIADVHSASEKYRLGQRLNCLITAQEFYDLLENAAQAKSNKSVGEAEEGVSTNE